MTPSWDQGGGLLRGPLLERSGPLPLTIRVRLGDVRPRFLSKVRAGRGYRAVARNGRVLLASPIPLVELTDQEVSMRFQVWHRAILPGAAPEPYGILLCVGKPRSGDGIYCARLVKDVEGSVALSLEVGGGLSLAFHRE